MQINYSGTFSLFPAPAGGGWNVFAVDLLACASHDSVCVCRPARHALTQFARCVEKIRRTTRLQVIFFQNYVHVFLFFSCTLAEPWASGLA